MSNGPYQIEGLRVRQGVTFDETRLFFFAPASGSTDPADQTPLNLTGATLRMKIRLSSDPSSTVLLSLTSTPTAHGSKIVTATGTYTPGPVLPTSPNGIEIVIPPAESLLLNSGVPVSGCYYDVLADLVGGTTAMLMCGTFDLLPTVTQ